MVRPPFLPASPVGSGLIPAPVLDLPADALRANPLPVIPPGADPAGEDLAAAVMDSAACRPVEEVADLLHRLDPDRAPALRRAAAARPIEDLVRLLALLRPRDPFGADEILRTAVLTRPADDVARLTARLAPVPDSGIRAALCAAAALRPVADVAQLAELLQAAPDTSETSEALAALDTADARGTAAAAHVLGPGTAPGTGETISGRAADADGPQQRPAAAPRARVRVRGRRARSPLRWPAAVALVANAALHLPLMLPLWGQNPVADAVFTAVSALCLLLALLLVLRDAPWVWIAGAAVGGSAITGYLLGGGTSLTEVTGDITQWQTHLGPAALVCEAALIALTLTHAAARRRRRPADSGPFTPAA
ncbi:hypothetical protein [Kitasatospora sp. NPDC088346]|uniref:hypothetical protein n=1 Tax=Kitasatospora sp. NPDC088346 TaxID=3364073 RepID=UPI0038158183